MKHESIYRVYNEEGGPQPDFYAQTSGIEYTLYALLGPVDVGVIAEYLWASERNFLSPFDNDIFAGLRFGFNDPEDTQILAGGIFDLDTSAKFLNLEASRRLSEALVASLEARYFHSTGGGFLASFERDSYVQLQIRYSF